MYIHQIQLEHLKSLVIPGKVVVIHGPRRVGKTTLLKKYLEGEKNYLFVTGEDIFVRDFLSSGSVDQLKDFIGTKELLVVDEVQYIPMIGLNLKLIVDHLPHVKVIATGSSTFDLAKQVGEPLTGRKEVCTENVSNFSNGIKPFGKYSSGKGSMRKPVNLWILWRSHYP